ncbi:ATP-dependent helicase [Listeria booriae]|uniref:DNA 3'-5' helicase n=2 Tax=Listeria booriae TaxID=1552123 RepID=A0A099W8T3_9LIST|nr:ATP-dependent helicase [Listeria booriae]KGL40485.1 ATPase AAA [Listeria booriae]MBC1905091.1 ATP-dependent helicase [Listeria booriae]STY42302.1 ATP-dependent DNA helicase pcrA [Listeria booriae]
MDDAIEFLHDLNKEQKKIVRSLDNLYITACPGSGKTRVLTRKIAYQSVVNKNSTKKIVAITYTNRAAEEIKDRLDFLGIDSPSVWVGTIHQFCLEFVIYPFGMNLTRLSRGFNIVDSYTQNEYVEEILSQLNIEIQGYEKNNINLSLTTEWGVLEKRFPEVTSMYHQKLLDNKEIDFDLILLTAYQILKESKITCRNIARVLRTIYIDEFQDTRDVQYNIIGLLTSANQSIQTLFVGDVDQAIYGGLSGVVKTVDELAEITGLSFKVEKLSGCYRSTQRMVDFYSEFQQSSYKINSRGENRKYIGKISHIKDIHKDDVSKKIADIISYHLNQGVPENEICIVAPQHYILFSIGDKLKELLPDSKFDAITISPIKVNDHSIFFKLSRLYFTDSGNKNILRKRIGSEILKILINEFNINLQEDLIPTDLLKEINSSKRLCQTSNGLEYFKETTLSLFCKLDITLTLYPKIFVAFERFINETKERMERNNLSYDIENFRKVYYDRNGITLTTAHKVKGEEYNTMIAINILDGKIPHWSEIYDTPDKGEGSATKLLYVICSRAKENLYLISERGYKTNTGYEYKPTFLIKRYQFPYDRLS